jgi:hypothetical protein
MLKGYLKEKKFSFTEKFVDMDEAAKGELEASSGGFLGVPFTIITLDNDTQEKVIGFDKGKINTILGLKE